MNITFTAKKEKGLSIIVFSCLAFVLSHNNV